MNFEKYFEVTLGNGEKVTIGLNSAIYHCAMTQGDFIRVRYIPGLPAKLVCVWLSVGDPVIIMFEAGEDSVYRIVLDIYLKNDETISITKIIKSGTERRVDLKVFG